jgi:hypothetical protein
MSPALFHRGYVLLAVDKKHWQSCCQSQSDHCQGDNPHEKHDLLLFDDPKISHD